MCTPQCFNSDAMQPDLRAAARLAGASLDIDESIRAHAAWSRRLSGYIAKHEEDLLDAEQIADERCCVLGQWLHTDGHKHLGGYHCFTELLDLHKQFHIEAARVVSLSQDLKTAEAQAGLHGELTRLSDEISRHLQALKAMLQQDEDEKLI